MDRSAYDVFLEMDEKHFWRIAKRRLVLATILRHVAPDAPLRILDIGACFASGLKSDHDAWINSRMHAALQAMRRPAPTNDMGEQE
jgi:hypothetical protein